MEEIDDITTRTAQLRGARTGRRRNAGAHGVRRWRRRVQQPEHGHAEGRTGPVKLEDHDRQLRRRRDGCRQGRSGQPGPRSPATPSRSSRPPTWASSSARPSPAAPRRTCSTPTPRSIGTSPRPATSTPTATRSRMPASCRSLVQTFTYDGKLQCAPKDYSTLAPGHQHRPVGQGRPDRRRHPEGLGRPGDGGQEADQGQGHRPGDRQRHQPRRRLHGAGRWLGDEQGRHQGHRRHPAEPGGAGRDEEDDVGRVAEVHDRHQPGHRAGAARRSARAWGP